MVCPPQGWALACPAVSVRCPTGLVLLSPWEPTWGPCSGLECVKEGVECPWLPPLTPHRSTGILQAFPRAEGGGGGTLEGSQSCQNNSSLCPTLCLPAQGSTHSAKNSSPGLCEAVTVNLLHLFADEEMRPREVGTFLQVPQKDSNCGEIQGPHLFHCLSRRRLLAFSFSLLFPFFN